MTRRRRKRRDDRLLIQPPAWPEPGQAARLTVQAAKALREVKDFTADGDHALDCGALSAEHMRFLIHNHVDPAIDLLTTVRRRLDPALDGGIHTDGRTD